MTLKAYKHSYPRKIKKPEIIWTRDKIKTVYSLEEKKLKQAKKYFEDLLFPLPDNDQQKNRLERILSTIPYLINRKPYEQIQQELKLNKRLLDSYINQIYYTSQHL